MKYLVKCRVNWEESKRWSILFLVSLRKVFRFFIFGIFDDILILKQCISNADILEDQNNLVGSGKKLERHISCIETNSYVLRSSFLLDSICVATVPEEILNLNLINLGVYGNNLSNLTAVDGSVVCSTLQGEHYCNCENHCVVSTSGEPDRCACADGQACCRALFENLGVQECLICSDGFEEPNKVGLCM